MRIASWSRAAALALVALTLSCDRHQPLAPHAAGTGPMFDPVSGTGPLVVISQVYGGGGNTNATWKNDFVELFNRGDAPAALTGWSVQYASASGTGNFSGNSPVALSGTLAPGQYYLVRLAGGTTGAALPTADASATAPNLAAASGKVILANTTVGLACNGGSNPCSADQLAQIVDLIGYGSANFSETAPAPIISGNQTAEFRMAGGCVDTNNNSADFATATPAPRNTSSPTHSCAGGPPVRLVLSPSPASVSMGATLTFATEAKDADSIVVYPALTWTTGDASIATVSAGGVATPVALGTTTITATTSNGVSGSASITVTPPRITWLDVSSSSTSFPAGFQTQLFVTARTGSGGLVVPATFTFSSEDPAIATVMQVGNTAIVTGVAGSATRPGIVITATPLDGASPPYVFTTHSITITTPVAAPVSIYGVNDEFGDPTAATTSNPNDLLIVRPQYTLSYNESRGTPNWVSYELDARQFGNQDRCNCFTADPVLPAAKQILTSDYTDGGYDRGHMTRSADRTAANLDNAATFYLTNIVPQMADLNQGPWALMEDSLGDSAEAGRAVYIISGPLYSRSHGLTFLKDEGKVAIPDSTWKVAFIGPATGGVPFTRADLAAWGDLPGHTLIAVMMPNVSGIRNVDWKTYLTTVDKIEVATGYDFLSLLEVAFQTALEADDHAPDASFSVAGTPIARAPLAFDATAATDPDLGRTDMDHAEALSWAWDFGDGSGATGATASKAFAAGGTYTVTLTVTDAWGWPTATSKTIQVLTPVQGIAAINEQIASLGGTGGPLGSGELNSLRAKLNAAAAACRRDGGPACGNVVGAFVNELQALVRSGRVSDALAAPIVAYAELVIASTGD